MQLTRRYDKYYGAACGLRNHDSHSQRKAKRAPHEKVLHYLLPEQMREPVREPQTIQ